MILPFVPDVTVILSVYFVIVIGPRAITKAKWLQQKLRKDLVPNGGTATPSVLPCFSHNIQKMLTN